jgi:hypothetical protein
METPSMAKPRDEAFRGGSSGTKLRGNKLMTGEIDWRAEVTLEDTREESGEINKMISKIVLFVQGIKQQEERKQRSTLCVDLNLEGRVGRDQHFALTWSRRSCCLFMQRMKHQEERK